jgi:hypothetical protein
MVKLVTPIIIIQAMNGIARAEQEIEQQPIQNRLPDYKEQHSAKELQE